MAIPLPPALGLTPFNPLRISRGILLLSIREVLDSQLIILTAIGIRLGLKTSETSVRLEASKNVSSMAGALEEELS